MREEGYRLQATDYRTLTLRARYIFPVADEPIADAAITITVPITPHPRPLSRKGRGEKDECSPLAEEEIIAGVTGFAGAANNMFPSPLAGEASNMSPSPLAGEGLGVRDSTILWLGPWSSHSGAGKVINLGNAAIIPGLVNAHTHLEFSDLTAPLGTPGMSLPSWIRAVVAHRRSQTDADRSAAIQRGLEESARCGVTSLGEIATPGFPADLFFGDAVPKSVPTTTAFLELLGLSAERTAANKIAAAEHVGRGPLAGLSPHAPYTVRPELVQFAAEVSRDKKIPLAMHLAESRQEIELLESGRGEFYDLLRDFGAWEDGAIPRGVRPMDYLRLLAEADRAIVIHGTYLNDSEIEFLAARSDRMSVVYCPRTHAYFQHAPYPLAKLLAAGITVALGTDSRASNPDLNLFEEMRFIAGCSRIRQNSERHSTASEFSQIPPHKLLEIATLGGAKALGRDQEIGTLEPGKSADLTIIRLPDSDADPHELLFDPRSAVPH